MQVGSIAPDVVKHPRNIRVDTSNSLITFDATIRGHDRKVRVLLDSGASENFVRSALIKENKKLYEQSYTGAKHHRTLVVRLATGQLVRTERLEVDLRVSFDEFDSLERFIVLEMDSKYDVILGMPWLAKHQPWIDWSSKTIGSIDPKRQVHYGALESNVPSTVEEISPRHSPDSDCQVATSTVVRPYCSLRCRLNQEALGVIPSSGGVPTGMQCAGENSGAMPKSGGLSTSTRCASGAMPKSGGLSTSTRCASGEMPKSGGLPTSTRCAEETSGVMPKSGGVSTNTGCVTSGGMPKDGGISICTRCAAQEPDSLSTRDDVSTRTHEVIEGEDNEPFEFNAVAARAKRARAVANRGHFPPIDSPRGCLRAQDSSIPGKVVTFSDPLEVEGDIPPLHLPVNALEALHLPEMGYDELLEELKEGTITQLCVLTEMSGSSEVDLCSSSTMDDTVIVSDSKKERFESQGWDKVKKGPFYDLLWEFRDVFPDEVPSTLPLDKGIQHEIDLVPGTKYCVTRQWPLPRDQVEAIDAFFAAREKAGHVRESKSPHSSPTFCVKKPTGGWRIVHAFNKLNAATIPAQTPIPRKDVIIDGMVGSTIYSTLDLRDGFYQLLMRDKDVPLTAVSTPSGMLWEWLVMPQGLQNAPATFNRCVSQLLRPLRSFAPSYFDDIYVHSKAANGRSDVEVHREHLRALLVIMREHKLYANLQKCIFGAKEIPVLGCFVGVDGVRADPEKIRAVSEWPIPHSVKDLRKFLGLANYLHKYSHNYAELVRPLSGLLKKSTEWHWDAAHQSAFAAIKQSLLEAPVLALPNGDKPFTVVCDASDFAIGCALMQRDAAGVDRVISYQSRQLRPAERNYPVHDKELLAMKYALVKFRVHLLGGPPFVVYTDHASLRTATQSPHLSQRMARWLSFFAEYQFKVEYKPGKFNILADALSRRPDFEGTAQQSEVIDFASINTRIESPIFDLIRSAYAADDFCRHLRAYFRGEVNASALPPRIRARIHRFSYEDDLLWFAVEDSTHLRVVVPHDADAKYRLLYEHHDTAVSGHLGREKTYLSLARNFWWPNMYKWVRTYVKSCDVCQRVKAAPHSQAPLQSLPVPSDCWKSVSMDFIFGFPADALGRTGVLVFVDRLSKMVHLAAVTSKVTAEQSASLFMETVFKNHGMPTDLVSDRDPRFTAAFWQELFRLVGTSLSMSTADHPETDGQTERANRVIGAMLRSFSLSHPKDWSEQLPMVEFAMNNAVHASTGYTPFYMNHLRHPRIPALLSPRGGAPSLGGGGIRQDVSHHIDAQRDVGSVLYGHNTLGYGVQQHDVVGAENALIHTHYCGVQQHDAENTYIHTPCSGVQQHDVVAAKQADTLTRFGDTHHFGAVHSPLDVVQRDVVDNPTVGIDGDTTHTSSVKGETPYVEQLLAATTNSGGDKTLQRIAATRKGVMNDFLLKRRSVIQEVRDMIADSVDKQKQYADLNGRKCILRFKVGEKVLLSTKTLPMHVVNNVTSNKLLPKYIGPFTVVKVCGTAYTLDIPSSMKTHPTFYVGRLKPYHTAESVLIPSEESILPQQTLPEAFPPLQAHSPDQLDAVHTRASPARRQGGRLRRSARLKAPTELRPQLTAGRRAEYRASPQGALRPQGPSLRSRDRLPLSRQQRQVVSRAQSSPLKGARLGRRSLRAALTDREGHVRVLRRRKDAGLIQPEPQGPSSTAKAATELFLPVPRALQQLRAPQPLLGENNSQHWHVEHLVRRRTREGAQEYLVKWLGHHTPTWEPRERLREDIPDVVESYERLHPLRSLAQ